MIRYEFDAKSQGMPQGEYCLYSEVLKRDDILKDFLFACRTLDFEGVKIPYQILGIYYRAEKLLDD